MLDDEIIEIRTIMLDDDDETMFEVFFEEMKLHKAETNSEEEM